jgi:hypothetical protein
MPAPFRVAQMDATVTMPPPTRPPAESNWPVFAATYGRAILDWFRQAELSPPQIESLVRDLMQWFGREFPQVSAEPSLKFRPWLQYAGHAAWCRLMESRVNAVGKDNATPEQNLLLSEASHDSFLKALEAECSHQRRREVLPRVQASADPTDWEVFYGVVLEGIPESDVAAQVQGTKRSVRAAVFRVYRTLEDELKRVEELF